MTTKNFNVKTGIKTGNITLDASTGNANLGNIKSTGVVSAVDLTLSGNLKSNLVPNANAVLSLGSQTRTFKELYLANILNIGTQTIEATNTGNLEISGNLVVANANITTLDANTANINTITVNNELVINSTTDSVSTTTGSVHTSGGIGVAKDLTVGGNINLAATGSSSPKGAINYNGSADSIDFKFK
jgi:hypothetical protein